MHFFADGVSGMSICYMFCFSASAPPVATWLPTALPICPRYLGYPQLVSPHNCYIQKETEGVPTKLASFLTFHRRHSIAHSGFVILSLFSTPPPPAIEFLGIFQSPAISPYPLIMFWRFFQPPAYSPSIRHQRVTQSHFHVLTMNSIPGFEVQDSLQIFLHVRR